MSRTIAFPQESRSSAASPAVDRSMTGIWMRSHPIQNPLWVIVIGMACFFGTTALIIAWS